MSEAAPGAPADLRYATNLGSAQSAALAAALGSGFSPVSMAEADLIVLEARGGHDELSEEQADAIVARVHAGASLLLTLDAGPQLSSMRLGMALPAITWQAAIRHRDYPPTGETTIAAGDPAFFPSLSLAGRTLPYFFPVQPVSADERGQSTYARYERNIPLLMRAVQPGDEFWTRPLALRDVQVRLWASDNARTPLLATARYGAGRSVVFGSGFNALTAGPSMLPAVLTWLAPSGVQMGSTTPAAAPSMEIEYGKHSIRLRLASASAMSVEVVGRGYDWAGAPLGFEHDLHRTIELTPGRPETLEMPLPEASQSLFQALEVRDSFRVSLAVLGNKGASTLVERQLLADFSRPVELHLMADDINHWQYPFHAPGSDLTREFGDRSGSQIGAYAYPPGAEVNVSMTLSNGLRDLGPLARVEDLNPPAKATNTSGSAAALIDGAMVAHKSPLDSVAAYSFWAGQPGIDNTLVFTFPHPVTLASIVLCGDWRMKPDTNPDAVSVQLDGRKLTSASGLAAQFAANSALVHLDFAPTMGTKVTVTFPARTDPQTRRIPIQLTEVRFEGWSGKAPEPVSGDLVLLLEDALAGTSTPLLHQPVSLKPGERLRIPVAAKLAGTSAEPAFYRMRASFGGETQSLPLMSLQPTHALGPYSDLVDPKAPSEGFIVTAGFRSCFPLGTGTAERAPGSWANPDDLIWAYSRRLKETGANAKTQANRLYLADTDMRHYAAPWRPFNNGVLFYTEAAPNLVDLYRRKPHYKEAATVHLGHSDRWDTGPHVETLHSWQDMVEFDKHLREAGKPGLTGKTRAEVADEIHGSHEDEWQAWQLGLYLTNLRTVRDAFAADGKRLVITAQGVPIVAGAAGAELAKTIQAMSDDHSWGMAEGSVSLTTGRQIGELAYNPVWKMSTLIQYGYSNGPLMNAEWHSPPGTLEPTRREYYDRAWRATIWPDGRYGSVYSVGYNSNAGISYRMTENDFVHWFRIEELHSLLSPEEPLGAGIVISTSRFADPNHIRFTADGNLFNASPDGMALARLFQRLSDAGLSVPFGANAATLSQWKGSAPLIVITPEVFSGDEITALEQLRGRGVRMVAFTTAALPPRLAALFHEPGTLIAQAAENLTAAEAEALVPQLHKTLDLPLHLPPNTRGYGFRQAGVNFIVVEEWRSIGHTTQLRVRAQTGKTSAQACTVNDHVNLKVTRSGDDWVVELPLRPGDGQLIAVREL